jgi:hypothetical protein
MKDGLISQLRWTKVGTAPPAAGEAFALPPQPRPRTSTGLALELYGLPEVPDEHRASPHAEARYLLKVAAEVEHGLLVQYLYAKYSINGALPQAAGWAKTIRNIASI